MLKKCILLIISFASVQIFGISLQSNATVSVQLPPESSPLDALIDPQAENLDNNSIDTFIYDFELVPEQNQTISFDDIELSSGNSKGLLQRSLDFINVKTPTITVDYSQQFVSSIALQSLIKRQDLLEQKIILLETENVKLVNKIEEISTSLLYSMLFPSNDNRQELSDYEIDDVMSAEQPDQMIVTLSEIESLINTGDYEKSVRLLNDLLIEQPNEPRSAIAWYWLAECNYQLENWGQAEQAFAYLVATFPQHWRVPASIYKIGRIAEINNDTNKARTSYLKIIQNYPKSSVSLLSSNALQLLQHNKGR